MQALVTGGTGFLGRYLVEQLLARGDTVRSFSRGEYEFPATIAVDSIFGDIRDADAIREACQGIDTVFHTAAIPGIWGPKQLFESTNVEGTRNVIAACRDAGVKRLLITSSPSVVFDDRSHVDADESLPYPHKYLCHYARTKAQAEREVLAANGSAGLATCSIRPHLMWGPRDNHLVPRLLNRAVRGKLIRVGDGTNRISQIYVEDAAAAHLQAADRLSLDSPVAGQAYFVESPPPVNLWDWIDQILTAAGLPKVSKNVSYKTAYRAGILIEFCSHLIRRKSEPAMTRFLANQLSKHRTYRSQKAERDFGFRTHVGFEEGMRRLAADLPRMLTEARK